MDFFGAEGEVWSGVGCQPVIAHTPRVRTALVVFVEGVGNMRMNLFRRPPVHPCKVRKGSHVRTRGECPSYVLDPMTFGTQGDHTRERLRVREIAVGPNFMGLKVVFAPLVCADIAADLADTTRLRIHEAAQPVPLRARQKTTHILAPCRARNQFTG